MKNRFHIGVRNCDFFSGYVNRFVAKCNKMRNTSCVIRDVISCDDVCGDTVGYVNRCQMKI